MSRTRASGPPPHTIRQIKIIKKDSRCSDIPPFVSICVPRYKKEKPQKNNVRWGGEWKVLERQRIDPAVVTLERHKIRAKECLGRKWTAFPTVPESERVCRRGACYGWRRKDGKDAKARAWRCVAN